MEMEKFLSWILLALPLVMAGQSVILSRNFTDELIAQMKITQKHIQNGTVLVITAKDPRVADRVKEIVMDTIRKPQFSRVKPDKTLELLRIKEIQKSVIILNNGIKLGLTSTIPEWISRIHQLKLEKSQK